MKDTSVQNRENQQVEPTSETLLALNRRTNKVEMVKGLDKEGNLQTFSPDNKQENDQFIRVDKHGDLFSNFFSNFYRQLKNPTDFSFFRISEYDAVNTAKDFQQYVNHASADEK